MTIDPYSHTPVYVQLADLLREQIESGELPAGANVGSPVAIRGTGHDESPPGHEGP